MQVRGSPGIRKRPGHWTWQAPVGLAWTVPENVPVEGSVTQSVYAVSSFGGGCRTSRFCAASLPRFGEDDAIMLCGQKATKSIGPIDLCDACYFAAAAWREQLPAEARLADIADRHAWELHVAELEAGHRTRLEAARGKRAIIYYLRRANGDIKIGTTSNPSSRFSTLGKEHGPLQLLLTHSGSYERENELHEKFADLAVGGEWFTARKRLTDWVKKCRLDPAIAASQLPRTVGMDVIAEVVREGIRASLAVGRAEREQIERETEAALAYIRSGALSRAS